MKIFAMRDKTANVFIGVNVDQSEDTAKRAFSYAVNNTPQLTYCAKDYELYMLADFNENTGAIDPIVPSILICRGDEVIAK